MNISQQDKITYPRLNVFAVLSKMPLTPLRDVEGDREV